MTELPFVVSQSNHERAHRVLIEPFDNLRANGGRNLSVTYINVNSTKTAILLE